MCNLYSITKGQKAIRDLAKAMVDHAGNMPSLPGIFPDGVAPVVRTTDEGQRELLMMRWGFPSPSTTTARHECSQHRLSILEALSAPQI